MYSIRINSRQLINFVMTDYLQLDPIQSQLMIRLFDRKDKIAKEEFAAQAEEIFDNDKVKPGMDKIAKLLDIKTISDLPSQLAESTPAKEIIDLFSLLKVQDVTSAVFDISLMRGFEYYTGIVFEFFDNNPINHRSMFGG